MNSLLQDESALTAPSRTDTAWPHHLTWALSVPGVDRAPPGTITLCASLGSATVASVDGTGSGQGELPSPQSGPGEVATQQAARTRAAGPA